MAFYIQSYVLHYPIRSPSVYQRHTFDVTDHCSDGKSSESHLQAPWPRWHRISSRAEPSDRQHSSAVQVQGRAGPTRSPGRRAAPLHTRARRACLPSSDTPQQGGGDRIGARDFNFTTVEIAHRVGGALKSFSL